MSAGEPRIRMYTTRWCGYCINAKRVLDAEGIAYTEHDVGSDRGLRALVARQTGWRTVPMIFVDDEFIGGYTELMRYRSQNGLGHLNP